MRDNKIKVNDLYMWKFTETTAERPIFNKTVFDFLKSKYNKGMMFGLENLKRSGIYKIHGWCIDFRPHLKKFYYKYYDSISEAYAPTKTDLIKSTYGKIWGIVEVKQK